jgi:maltose-binding protein MalE
MNNRKLYALLVMLLMGVLLLAACGGGEEAAPEPEAPAEEAAPAEEEAAEEAPAEEEAAEEEVAEEEPMEEPTEEPMEEEAAEEEAPAETTATLTILADETLGPILEEFIPDYAAQAGIEVVVESVAYGDIGERVRNAIPAGEGPDIFVSGHDQIGNYIEGGLIAPVDVSTVEDNIIDSALEAFTYNSEIYALPYATENVALFRNADLVSEPVSTWDEMMEVGATLMDEGAVENVTIFPNTNYHLYGINTAYGGYIFGTDEDGNFLPEDVGLDSPGFIASAEFIQDAVNEGYVPSTPDGAAADALFAEGGIPFVINGPWGLNTYREAGVNYVVDPLPEGPEGPGAPFLGARGFMINAQSENQLLAQAFLTELVATDEIMGEIQDRDPRIPAWIPVLDALEDEDIANFGVITPYSQPMPNIPEMGAVWGSWDSAMQLVLNGEDPSESLTNGAEQVREAIAGE